MLSNLAFIVFLLLVFVHLYANIRLTGDVYGWVPEARKRKIFFWLVWLLPFVGAFYVYRRLAPDWFTPDRDSGDSESSISSGLLGLESFVNPNARHISEARKKPEITIKAEGEMYDRQLPDFVDVEMAQKQVNEADEKSV